MIKNKKIEIRRKRKLEMTKKYDKKNEKIKKLKHNKKVKKI